ncbi:tail fiber protein [Serratia marcescens]|uniref:tail fiber protein n=1 Tax=Serratia marcescens TaxID=615 RepID=UPI001F14B5B3|nr:tail fiber protein [Serratia marcescens]
MAEKNYNIQTGSRVDVRFSLDTDSDTASIFDPGYAIVNELAQFPELKRSNEVQTIENYDADYTSKQIGDQSLTSSQLVVNEIPNDESQLALKAAADERKLVRFQNIYYVDTGEDVGGQQQGFYQIFDAYVSGYKRTGDGVSQLSFNVEPTGKILAEGVSQVGQVLHQGDFGVGAGTAEFPGPKDTSSLIGNSWRTFTGSNSDNPFSQDTTLIHSQPNENKAWQITGTVDGTPDLRFRNIQKNGNGITKSSWVRVFTDVNKPTPDDVDAVSRKGDTMTGDLTISTPNAARINMHENMIRSNQAGGQELVISTNKHKMLFRTNGDMDGLNQMEFLNGLLTVPNITAQRIKVAIQGTDPTDVLSWNTWNTKGFTRIDGAITNTDWNALTQIGIYKIHANSGANGPDMYMHGVLTCYQAGSDNYNEGRLVQVYFPHRTDAAAKSGFAYRTRNAGSWTGWNYFRNEATNDLRYVKKDGDVMNGTLEINNVNGWFRMNGKDIACVRDGKNYYGDMTQDAEFRVKTGKGFTLKDNANRVGAVYSELNKPTAADVGALTENQYHNLQNGKTVFISDVPSTKEWRRVGTVKNLIGGGRQIAMQVYGGAGYNANPNQNGHAVVIFKTGDGSANNQTVNAISRGAMTAWTSNTVCFDDMGVIEVAKDTYEIWFYCGSFTNGMKVHLYAGNDEFLNLNWTSDGKTKGNPTFVMRSSIIKMATDQQVQDIWTTQGSFTKTIMFESGISFPKLDSGNPSTIVAGNGDGASYDKCNLDIRPWYGLGFYNPTTTGIRERSGYIDVRTGSMRMAGTITADGAIAVATTQKSDTSHTAIMWDRGRQRMRFATDNIGVDIHGRHENDVVYVGPGGKAGIFINTLNAQQQLGTGFVSKTDESAQTIKSDFYSLGSMKPRTIVGENFNANTSDADPSSWKDGIELITTSSTNNNWPVATAVGLKFRASMHRHGQIIIGADNQFFFRSLRGDRASNPWDRVYTVSNPPSAGTVGAYTKAESDGRFLKLTGGTLTGALNITGANLTVSGTINSAGSVKSTGGGNPGAYGAHIQWGVTNNGSGAPTGCMHFTNHRGALTNIGGWIFESKADGQPNQIKAALMTKEGDLSLEGGLTAKTQSNFNGIVNIGKTSKIIVNRSDMAINAIEVDSKNWLSIGDVKSSTVIKTIGLEVEVADGRRGKIFNELTPPTAAQCNAIALGEVIDAGTF